MEKFLYKIGFDKVETQFFSQLYLKFDDTDKEILDTLGTEFSSGKGVGICRSIQEKLKPLAPKYNVDEKSVDMLFFLSNLEKMRQNFIKKGIDQQLFYDSAKDLKYKLDECKKYKGVLGVRTFDWYYDFFNGEMVALGRLQFHKIKFFDNTYYKWNNITVTPQDTVINMHIPSSGPLTREMRLESYKKAFDFFGKKKGEYLVLVGATWLIYPGYREVYQKGSNLADFMDDFDIIKEEKVQENTFPNSILVFGMEYGGETSRFPANTSLQKNFIRYLNDGKPCGFGYGVIIFDGEKIINNKRDADGIQVI